MQPRAFRWIDCTKTRLWGAKVLLYAKQAQILKFQVNKQASNFQAVVMRIADCESSLVSLKLPTILPQLK